MEARKITVVLTTNAQAKKVIMSSAVTLGELKADLDAQGIDYTDMDFYEGVSKTDLKRDDSILPTNIPYKGSITNELVFVLSTTNKKIRSGMTSRKALYNIIKNEGLEDAIKGTFGRNYTQVSSTELEDFIEENLEEEPEAEPQAKDGDCAKALDMLLDVLEEDDYLFSRQTEPIRRVLKGDISEPGIDSPYEKDELDEMIDDCLS
jgi:hypothetical protein